MLLNPFSLGLFAFRVSPSERDVFEFPAVGQHDLINNPYRCAGLRPKDVDSDYLARMHDVPRPTKRAHRGWTARFADPMHDVAVIILYVEREDIMWIGPEEFRHRRVLQGDQVLHVVRYVSVMRENRCTSGEKNYNRSEHYRELALHIMPPASAE